MTISATDRPAAPNRTLGDLTAVEKIEHANTQARHMGEYAHRIRTGDVARDDGMTQVVLNAYEGQVLAALALAADEVRDMADRLREAEDARDGAQATLEDIAGTARRATFGD